MEKAAVYPLIGIPSRRDRSSRSGSPVFAQEPYIRGGRSNSRWSPGADSPELGPGEIASHL